MTNEGSAISSSRGYTDLMSHLRDARAALRRAEQALDLWGPAGPHRHAALDNLVGTIQMSAELIGERTGTNERDREYQRAAAAPLVDGPAQDRRDSWYDRDPGEGDEFRSDEPASDLAADREAGR
jgi:hypothetical protein